MEVGHDKFDRIERFGSLQFGFYSIEIDLLEDFVLDTRFLGITLDLGENLFRAVGWIGSLGGFDAAICSQNDGTSLKLG